MGLDELHVRNGHRELEPPRYTDAGNARRLVIDHGSNLRYVPQLGRWFWWDETRFRRDETGEVTRRALATVKGLYAAAAYEDDAAVRKELLQHATRSESARALRDMIALAQAQPELVLSPGQLDVDPWLLNTPSGVVHLRTGEFRAARREDLITKITSAPYVPGARHPVLDRFLDRVLPDVDVRRFVQRFAGYALTGTTFEEKLAFFHGPTASGKSTFLAALRQAMGEYATVADFTTFLERGQQGPREDIARLVGVRLVVSMEVKDGSRLAEALVKTLTGGDAVAARYLYGQTFEFRPQFKLFLAANHRPKARDDDDALWRRILEVPFRESIPEGERDPELKRVLCDPTEGGPAVLAWAIEGAVAWAREGLRPPDAVRTATEDYRQAMDPLGDFFEDSCRFEPSALATAKELNATYETWAKGAGIRNPLTAKALAERLKARGCEPYKRTGGARWWRGIGLLMGESGGSGGGVAGSGATSTSPLYARAGREVTEEPPLSATRHDPPLAADAGLPEWVR